MGGTFENVPFRQYANVLGLNSFLKNHTKAALKRDVLGMKKTWTVDNSEDDVMWMLQENSALVW